ncbi:DUF5316 domain-containing protein [Clostridium sp. BL-8]|uniref:DUF5316 domain-containing protein n=1 Tax=Clostridium sp. BL-8 TaxID=349938 RepID=UPI00098C46C4|nr:DUF5316 domain-containing protein [Clostridium sp. BL-8]OOM78026.1 hypothetical protein CLOBL_25660 [Clostridium sp. BL-8]
MKLSFFIGVLVAIVAHTIGVVLNDYNITLKIFGVICIGSFILSGILSGTFISGDRYRANSLSETKEDKNRRMKIVNKLILLSIPSLIDAVAIVILK